MMHTHQMSAAEVGRIFTTENPSIFDTDKITLGGFTKSRHEWAYYLAGTFCGLKMELYLTPDGSKSAYRSILNYHNELQTSFLKDVLRPDKDDRYFSIGKIPYVIPFLKSIGMTDCSTNETHWLKRKTHKDFYDKFDKYVLDHLEAVYTGKNDHEYFQLGKNGLPINTARTVRVAKKCTSTSVKFQSWCKRHGISVDCDLRRLIRGAGSENKHNDRGFAGWHLYSSNIGGEQIAFDVIGFGRTRTPLKISHKKECLEAFKFRVVNYESLPNDQKHYADRVMAQFCAKHMKHDGWKNTFSGTDYVERLQKEILTKTDELHFHHVPPAAALESAGLSTNNSEWIVPLMEKDHEKFSGLDFTEFPQKFIEIGIGPDVVSQILHRSLLAVKKAQQSSQKEGNQTDDLASDLKKAWKDYL